MTLKEKVLQFAKTLQMPYVDYTESMIERELMEIIYSHFGMNRAMAYFSLLYDVDKEKTDAKINMMRMGLEMTIHKMNSLSKSEFNKLDFYALIDSMKVMFPNGEKSGQSKSACQVFDRFLEDVAIKKVHFSIGGKDRQWLETFGHDAYFDMVIEKNDIKTI